MTRRDWLEFRRHVRVLERALAGVLDADALCCGVTVAQCHALLAIEERGETGVTELAVALGLDKSTASRTVDAMVAAGLVTRRTDPRNRRRLHVNLTARGRRAAAGIHRQWNDYYRGLFARIPRARHAAVVEGVRQLAEAVTAAAPAAERGGDA